MEENKMLEQLKSEIELSDTVNDAMKQAYDQILDPKTNKVHRRSGKRLVKAAAGVLLAGVVGGGVFLTSHPAVAQDMPLVGHIFEMISDVNMYPGDYSSVATPLVADSVDAGDASQGAETGETNTTSADSAAASLSPYVQTSNGITVTLSEIYCSKLSLCVTMQIQSEEAFPETMVDQFGSPMIGLKEITDLSFYPEYAKEKAAGETDELYQPSSLDGKMVDDHTYVGVLRVPLPQRDMTAYQEAIQSEDEVLTVEENDKKYADLIRPMDIPDTFHATLDISKIIGSKADPPSIYEVAGVEEPTEEELQEMLDSMSPEEWNEYQMKIDALAPTYNYPVNEYLNYIYDVDMHFDFDVNVDTERVKTIEVNDVDSGYPHYLESVTVTPFDIGIQAHGQEGDYQVLLDANGTLVKDLGLKTPISNYDLSKIDYYVIPWETFSEGGEGLTKGDIYEERTEEKLGLTLREALNQYCSYHKEVVIS